MGIFRFCWLLLCASTSAFAITPSNAPITLDAASSEIDGRTNQILLKQVVIRQLQYVIRANQARATGLDFQNSRWVFSGAVDITTPEGRSTGDEATVNFVDNQLRSAQLVGQPATFAQRAAAGADSPTVASGRANNMLYDFSKNTVKLTGAAWIEYNQNEFKGNSVTYDVLQRKVMAKSEDQEGERVHITIKPNQTPAPSP